jgi:predicted nuclease with TOPRIM domain
MGLKEAYQEKLEAQLKEWSAKAKELQAKAETAKAEVKVELQKHLEGLRAKQEAAQEKLKEIKETGAHAWEKAKPGVEKAMSDLNSAWDRIKKHFS